MKSYVQKLGLISKQYMKNVICFLVLLLISLDLIASDKETINSCPDSMLIVYLEQSKDLDCVELVFENTSLRDTIKLISIFKYFGDEYETHDSGFNIHIFRNNEIMPKTQTEIALLNYDYGENGYITIAPQEKVSLPVSLTDKIAVWDKRAEYGAIFFINYKYVIIYEEEQDDIDGFNKRMRFCFRSQVKTNYVPLRGIEIESK